jgi:ABC-type antimicrobial peptide transport system permease subunit
MQVEFLKTNKPMELTGKAKEDFKKWYNLKNFKILYIFNEDGDKDYLNLNYEDEFIEMPNSMQYGVYVDFFDSVDIEIRIDKVSIDSFYPTIDDVAYTFSYSLTSRLEARTAAIEKANELYNLK